MGPNRIDTPRDRGDTLISNPPAGGLISNQIFMLRHPELVSGSSKENKQSVLVWIPGPAFAQSYGTDRQARNDKRTFHLSLALSRDLV